MTAVCLFGSQKPVRADAVDRLRQMYGSATQTEASEIECRKAYTAAQLAAHRWRFDLGRELLALRSCWPARGPNAKGWGDLLAAAERYDGSEANGLAPDYPHWTADHINEFVQAWAPRCLGWMVALTDDRSLDAWRDAYERVGRYASFSAIACVITGMTVRVCGDGPGSWCVYAVVSRPRRKPWSDWGALPGAYVVPRSASSGYGRGKPIALMSALVRDYTKLGDLICDPLAGWGTTLAAAIANGRRAIGAEIDAAAHAEALRRLSRPLQLDMLEAGAA